MAHLLRFRGRSTLSLRAAREQVEPERLRAGLREAALEPLDPRARRDGALTAGVGGVAARADLERLAAAGRVRLDHGSAGRARERGEMQLGVNRCVHLVILLFGCVLN